MDAPLSTILAPAKAAVGSTARFGLVAVGIAGASMRSLELAATLGNWSVACVSSIGQAQQIARTEVRGLIVLSEDIASESAIRRLTREHPTTQVFVWSNILSSKARGMLMLAGALDILSDRMSDQELFARLSKGSGGHSLRQQQTSIGALTVDSFRGEATWNGQRMGLTNRERDVLDVLMLEQGQTLRREVIYERVWGHTMPSGDRNVDVNVKRLRNKLAAVTGGAATIETINRIGYHLQLVHGLHDDQEHDS